MACVDVKTGKIRHTSGLQTAAYMNAWNSMAVDMRDLVWDRYVVQLTDGDYKVQQFENHGLEFDIFIASLNIMRYKERTKGAK